MSGEAHRSIAPLVLFDLDGTLVDTAPDLRAALDRLLAQHGRPPVEAAPFRATVSRGGSAMLTVGVPDFDDAQRLRLLPEFLALYDEAIAVHSRLFDGMAGVLGAITAADAQWGVVTNKPERLARRVIDALGLAAGCAVLIGGDTLPTRKPDPAPLLEACRRVGVAPTRCVYVGDDRRDMEAARAACMPGVGARWGYFAPGERIEDWGAVRIASRPPDLLDAGMLRGGSA